MVVNPDDCEAVEFSCPLGVAPLRGRSIASCSFLAVPWCYAPVSQGVWSHLCTFEWQDVGCV